MPRLLALPLVLGAALAFSAPASAEDDCYKLDTPNAVAGVCAGVRPCVDICGLEPYAYPVCSIDIVITAACAGGIH